MTNQRGQVSVEIVLLAVLLTAGAMGASKAFRSSNALSNLVEGPWSYIDGMARHGNWAPAKQARNFDPNFLPRRASLEPEQDR